MQTLIDKAGAKILPAMAGYLLGSRTVLTTAGAGTYTTPAACRLLVVECIGGGGAGGASSGNSTAGQIKFGSGGCGGGYAVTVVPTVGGRTFSYVVGAGGSISVGLASTFSSNLVICSAVGGAAGGASASAATELFLGVGASVGAGSQVGDVSTGPSVGGIGHRVSGTVGMSGPGGLGPHGGSALPAIAQGNGNPGGKYGGGGSGAMSINAGGSVTGGAGADGAIIVSEYY